MSIRNILSSIDANSFIYCWEFQMIYIQLPNICRSQLKYSKKQLGISVSFFSYASILILPIFYYCVLSANAYLCYFLISLLPTLATLIVYYGKPYKLIYGSFSYLLFGALESCKSIVSQMISSEKNSQNDNNKDFQYLSIVKKGFNSLSCFISQDLYTYTLSYGPLFFFTFIVQFFTLLISLIKFLMFERKSLINEDSFKKCESFLNCFSNISQTRKQLLVLSLVCDLYYSVNSNLHGEALVFLEDTKKNTKKSLKSGGQNSVNVLMNGFKGFMKLLSYVLVYILNIGNWMLNRTPYEFKDMSLMTSNSVVNVGYSLGITKFLVNFLVYIIQAHVLDVKQFESALQVIFVLVIISLILYTCSSSIEILNFFYFTNSFLLLFIHNIKISFLSDISNNVDRFRANITVLFLQSLITSIIESFISYMRISIFSKIKCYITFIAFTGIIVSILSIIQSN